MKHNGNLIIGDPVQLDIYTAGWETVRLHPTVYYRRQTEFCEGLKHTKGLFAEIDMGDFVYIRFAEKEDLTNFHKIHHEYV